MHWQNLFVESVVVVATAEVELPDRDGAMAGLPETMPPARFCAVPGMPVVPATDFMDMEIGEKMNSPQVKTLNYIATILRSI